MADFEPNDTWTLVWAQYADKSSEKFIGAFASEVEADNIIKMLNAVSPSMEIKRIEIDVYNS